MQESTTMSDQGRDVAARRARLGMSIEDLADEAGVNRDTLSDFESGKRKPRDTNVAKIVAALERIEHETGLDAPAAPESAESGELMEIRAEGVYGIQSIVVNGPVRDRDELVETIARLIERVRRENP